ncbi:uncharacterized protein [Gossypium hirsutum]|uniref:Uncharacterized protein n=1 Tax=Gossypium hirsutum TaxID=3635 RepID=A0ABM2Z548_GOSHI|nr:uncharacterized protein LOC121209924 [Gossypium hirsutum]
MTMLIDAEARHQAVVLESPSLANMVSHQAPISATSSNSSLTYRPASASRGRGRGRSSGSRIQCQLCGKMGHLVDRCYHRFDLSYKSIGYRPPLSQANVCMFGQGAPISPWMASPLNTFPSVAPYLQPGWFIPPTSALTWSSNSSPSGSTSTSSNTQRTISAIQLLLLVRVLLIMVQVKFILVMALLSLYTLLASLLCSLEHVLCICILCCMFLV